MKKPNGVVFVVECDPVSKTDWLYLRKLLFSDLFIQKEPRPAIKPVYLGGKNKYQAKAVCDAIESEKKLLGKNTSVIYVFDTDSKCLSNSKRKK